MLERLAGRAAIDDPTADSFARCAARWARSLEPMTGKATPGQDRQDPDTTHRYKRDLASATPSRGRQSELHPPTHRRYDNAVRARWRRPRQTSRRWMWRRRPSDRPNCDRSGLPRACRRSTTPARRCRIPSPSRRFARCTEMMRLARHITMTTDPAYYRVKLGQGSLQAGAGSSMRSDATGATSIATVAPDLASGPRERANDTLAYPVAPTAIVGCRHSSRRSA